MSDRTTRAVRLDSLTGLRFLAALWVVLTHVVTNRTNPDALIDLGPAAGRFTELGYLGVTFFFVLSGFVLTWSAGGRRMAAGDFYRRRLARIYPLHLVTTLLAGAAILAAGRVVATADWPLCLLLVQAWVPDSAHYLALNSVSWSLACEAFFYLLTPMLLRWALTRSLATCVAAAGALCVTMMSVAVIVLTCEPDRDQDVWFSPWYSLGTFTAGMALALALQRGVKRWPSIRVAYGGALVALAVLVTLSWYGSIGRTVATLIVLPAVLVLIGAAALRDCRGAGGLLQRRWMVRLGEWSFALYLTHKMVLGFFRQYLSATDNPALIVLALATALGVAALAHLLLEKPAEARFRPPQRVRG